MDNSDSNDSSDTGSFSRSPLHKRRHASNGDSSDKISSDAGNITCIRFLITNAEAGSVIGKGGATISDLQSQSGCKIHLSRNHEYFPGTNDRIVSLNGTISQAMTAFNLILTKLLNEVEDDTNLDLKTNEVRLIVPNNVCGALIGRAGATIKLLMEESHAGIKLSPQEQTMTGVTDRLVTVSGTLEQQLQAVSLIIEKLSEDRYYIQFANSPLSYTGANFSGMHGLNGSYLTSNAPISYGLTAYGTSGIGSNLRDKGLIQPLVGTRSAMSGALPVYQTGPQTTVMIAVPDEHVGAIVGRGGRTITEIQQASGANIKISERGDFVAGTRDRKVTISGSAEGIRVAQYMLAQKIDNDNDFR